MKNKIGIKIILIVIIFLLLFGCSGFKIDNQYNDSEGNIIKIINNQRIENGLNELKFDNFLVVLAEKRALYISEKPFESHYDLYGFLMSNRANKRFSNVAENLARSNTLNSNSIVKAWNNSKTHKANILSSRYDSVGVSILKSGDYYIVSILFGDMR